MNEYQRLKRQKADIELKNAFALGGTFQTIDFYEREFYPLSNFSSFRLRWKEGDFDTSEHAYHWEKFNWTGLDKGMLPRGVQRQITYARSAHEAFKIAEANKDHRRPEWDDVKVRVMREILLAKASQHEYVRRKLLETGDALLYEGSWRDGFWGIGPDKVGRNELGHLWMEIRDELRAAGGGK